MQQAVRIPAPKPRIISGTEANVLLVTWRHGLAATHRRINGFVLAENRCCCSVRRFVGSLMTLKPPVIKVGHVAKK